MEKITALKLQKFLLLVAALGLIPIALSNGLMPDISLGILFGIEVNNLNLALIMRAVMGLYIALIVFWIFEAFKPKLRSAALYSLVVFMYGLAAGRIISLLADGIPNYILMVYLLVELLFGTLAIFLIRKA